MKRSKDESKKVQLHDDHKKPVTRRDFLSAGLLSFSGYMVAPSIVQLLSSNEAFAAGAAQCVDASATRMPAFVSVNLSGGAALAGNFIPLDAGRQMFTDYSMMGMGTTVPPVEREFQGVGFVGMSNGRLTSQFLAGVRAGAAATTLAKTSFIGVAHPSQDDSNINKIDISGLVTAAGLRGSKLPKLGVRETVTGVNHDYALMRPPAPLVVTKLADLTNALGPTGALVRKLDANQRGSLLKLIDKLTGSQAALVASPNSASGTTLANLVSCATGKNIDLAAAGAAGVDPTLDTSVNVAGLWGMAMGGTQFGQSQNSRQAMASMVYNALNGNAGSVSLELGGYDYHGQGRPAQDQKDLEAGTVVGKILESAALMGQKVFIQVQSDGSVSANQGGALGDGFQSDHGISGMAYILAYDPAGRPMMKDDKYGYQLGSFTARMGAVSDAPVGSAEAAGVATFTNYMKFANAMTTFDTMLNRQYTAEQMDYVLRFA